MQNQWEVEGEQWMGVRVFDDATVRRRFIIDDEGIDIDETVEDRPVKWNEGAVHDYLRHIRRFKEALLVLVHMTAGEHIRGRIAGFPIHDHPRTGCVPAGQCRLASIFGFPIRVARGGHRSRRSTADEGRARCRTIVSVAADAPDRHPRPVAADV